MTTDRARLRQVVLDAVDTRGLAEFYREVLGFRYRDGDEPTAGGTADWLVLRDPTSATRVAFQQVGALPRVTWPDGEHPQQMHLDLTVDSVTALDAEHLRFLALGAVLLLDRSDDEEEPLRVYADPAGHPFCLFVAG
jgi:catechol 2,3-dioxygenase-like lactoylglutathione lyase family enzyme